MLDVLLARLIDDAAQFPPARLELDRAIEQHHEHRARPQAWMLGRFLCPASKLRPGLPDPVGVVSDGDWRADLEAAVAAGADCFEVRAPDDLDALREAPIDVFVEDVDPAELPEGVGAKLRCGGLSPEAFPSDERVAAFIRACRERGIRFKCTAGLHHPFRTRDEQIGVLQHGFINLLTATVVDDVEAAVAAPDDEFTLDGGLAWRGNAIDAAAARRLYDAHGSCSFEEPVADLAAHV